MKRKGFTLIEVMIALSLFALTSVVIVRANTTANATERMRQDKLKMTYIAQKEMEEWKRSFLPTKSSDTITDSGKYTGYNLIKTYENKQGDLFNVTIKVENQKTTDSVLLSSSIFGYRFPGGKYILNIEKLDDWINYSISFGTKQNDFTQLFGSGNPKEPDLAVRMGETNFADQKYYGDHTQTYTWVDFKSNGEINGQYKVFITKEYYDNYNLSGLFFSSQAKPAYMLKILYQYGQGLYLGLFSNCVFLNSSNERYYMLFLDGDVYLEDPPNVDAKHMENFIIFCNGELTYADNYSGHRYLTKNGENGSDITIYTDIDNEYVIYHIFELAVERKYIKPIP